MTQVPSYYNRAFDPRRFEITVRVVSKKVREMMKKHSDLRAIAACGQSGIPVAAAVAYATGLALTTVRKEGEPITHSGSFVTGFVGEGKYIIVDDLVDSGKTIRHIVSSIDNARKNLGGGALDPLEIIVYYALWGSRVSSGRSDGSSIPQTGVDSEIGMEEIRRREPMPSSEFCIKEAYRRARLSPLIR